VIADTNVLLRALDADSGPQARAVRARIEAARTEDARITVLSATVLEVAYVLESAAAGYGWDRPDVSRAIDAIVNEPAFNVEHGEALATAASTYRSRSIDLHDCLLAAVAAQRGTRVLSFDAELRKLGIGEKP
jgi:predicted nucleic-acid-binding protein